MENSYFHLILLDGTELDERQESWRCISEEVLVEFMGRQKTVLVCTLPVRKIIIKHGELETELEVAEGEEVYQAMRSQSTLMSDGETTTQILGRIIGKIKDGKVVEEQFLNSETNEVLGVKL